MKKDKNIAAEQTQPYNVKDYQQEEDKDVKEKHKVTKWIIIIILAIVIFFVCLLIWFIHDKSQEKFYDVNGVQSVANAQEGNIEDIDVAGCEFDFSKSGNTVDITIPLKYFEGNPPAQELTEEQKQSGYVAVKKSGDNIIYTVKTSYYQSIVDNLYEFHHDEYRSEKFLNDNDILLLAQFECMDKFTVTIEKKDVYEANKYYDMLYHAYNQAAIYQCYLGRKPADIKVDFQFKTAGAQWTFVTYSFPQLEGKKLSDVPYNNDKRLNKNVETADPASRDNK